MSSRASYSGGSTGIQLHQSSSSRPMRCSSTCERTDAPFADCFCCSAAWARPGRACQSEQAVIARTIQHNCARTDCTSCHLLPASHHKQLTGRTRKRRCPGDAHMKPSFAPCVTGLPSANCSSSPSTHLMKGVPPWAGVHGLHAWATVPGMLLSSPTVLNQVEWEGHQKLPYSDPI